MLHKTIYKKEEGVMGLIEILVRNNISGSSDFVTAINKQEKTFNRWSLILLCTIDDDLQYVMVAIKSIIKLDTKQAQAMALLARFKGQAVITNGEEKLIHSYVNQFNDYGLSAIAVDMFR